LRRQSVELRLLALRGFFVAPDLLRALRIDLATTLDHRELAFEPHANRIALRRGGRPGRRLLLRACGGRANNGERSRDQPAQ
jgi:hypothetical protein